MAFKYVVLAAFLAVASAGDYDISAVSGDSSSAGFSQESTQKGSADKNVVSSYTKSDDSAHSYVRVSSHSIHNGALLKYDVGHVPFVKTAIAAPTYYAKTYAAPYSIASPLLTKQYVASTPIIAKTSVAAAPALLAKSYGTPVAPLLTKSYATPFLTKSYASPLLTKSYIEPSAPLLTKTYEYAAHAPVVAKSALISPAHGYAAAIAPAHGYAATISPAHGYAAAISPAHGYAAAIAPAPLLTKTYAPQAHIISKDYGYEAASPVVHTVFNGLGTHYSW